MLKEQGVTRYKDGDFEVNLMPALVMDVPQQTANTDDELLFYHAPRRS